MILSFNKKYKCKSGVCSYQTLILTAKKIICNIGLSTDTLSVVIFRYFLIKKYRLQYITTRSRCQHGVL